jgi:hypothetical protein
MNLHILDEENFQEYYRAVYARKLRALVWGIKKSRGANVHGKQCVGRKVKAVRMIAPSDLDRS